MADEPDCTFHQIYLPREGWRVQHVDYLESENRVSIRIENTPAMWLAECCPACQCKVVSSWGHSPERSWFHLKVCQMQSEIVCALPRGKCQKCHHVYTVRAPWEGRYRDVTHEFEAFAIILMRKMPVCKAEEIYGGWMGPIFWRVLFAHLDSAWAGLSWAKAIWKSDIEPDREQYHHYLTVLVDLAANQVLLAVESRDKTSWICTSGRQTELGWRSMEVSASTNNRLAGSKCDANNCWNAIIVCETSPQSQ